MSAPKSVLIYSMGEVIGDGLIKLPFLASLRAAFPSASISWCAAKGSTVYEGPLAAAVAGHLDEVISQGVTGVSAIDFLALRRPFGGRRFDVVIDTQTNVRRSLVVRRAADLFISPSANFAFSHRRPAGPWPLAMVDRLQTLASLAAGAEVAPRPLAVRDEAALAAARRLLPEGSPYVGFAPGSGGVSKRWPLERFIELARRQAERGRTPVFFLGPSEGEMVHAIAAALPSARFPEADAAAAGETAKGPLLVIALAGRLRAGVANDAGPGHMMAAGGAGLLSLQGFRRKAEKFHPAALRLEMLVAEDYGAPGAMEAVPLEAADAALERLLEDRAP
jgi:ADP-heptose:LPS heptosyltransferase